MTTYKELADHLEAYFKSGHRMDEVIAILRSLDAQPVFWYRQRSDGGLEGPIHDGAIEQVRKDSGAWKPLYAAPVAAVRKAMARLADLLDEDKFMEIEGIFTSAGFTPPVAAQASKPLSDAADDGWHQTPAVKSVLAERQRQVNKEGWSELHDDEHAYGELSRAAAVYCLCSDKPPLPGDVSEVHQSRKWDFNILKAIWPREWVFNPKDRRSNLVRAAALMLAEIERQDRISLRHKERG